MDNKICSTSFDLMVYSNLFLFKLIQILRINFIINVKINNKMSKLNNDNLVEKLLYE